MSRDDKGLICRTVESVTPSIVKAMVKKVFWRFMRSYHRIRHIKKERFVEFGSKFRFSRGKPYYAYVGERTITDEFNVWNATLGDIKVGKECWLGLHNIITGPVEIGDKVSTGPYVMILGPRHPVLNKDADQREKTVIGNNVWISSGSMILFGVTIGDNAIISAGSVVTKDVPAGAFIGGNPARNLSAMADKMWSRPSPK